MSSSSISSYPKGCSLFSSSISTWPAIGTEDLGTSPVRWALKNWTFSPIPERQEWWWGKKWRMSCKLYPFLLSLQLEWKWRPIAYASCGDHVYPLPSHFLVGRGVENFLLEILSKWEAVLYLERVKIPLPEMGGEAHPGGHAVATSVSLLNVLQLWRLFLLVDLWSHNYLFFKLLQCLLAAIIQAEVPAFLTSRKQTEEVNLDISAWNPLSKLIYLGPPFWDVTSRWC